MKDVILAINVLLIIGYFFLAIMYFRDAYNLDDKKERLRSTILGSIWEACFILSILYLCL